MHYVCYHLGICLRFFLRRSDEFLVMDNSPKGLFWVLLTRMILHITGAFCFGILLLALPTDTPDQQAVHKAYNRDWLYAHVVVYFVFYAIYMQYLLDFFSCKDQYEELIIADNWFLILTSLLCLPWVLAKTMVTFSYGVELRSILESEARWAALIMLLPVFAVIYYWFSRYFRLFSGILETSKRRTIAIFALSFLPFLLNHFFADHLISALESIFI